MTAASDSVGEDGYQAYIPFVQLLALGVHALGTGAEGDIVLFRCDQSGIKAPIQKILNYCGCDFTRVFVFLKNAYFFRRKRYNEMVEVATQYFKELDEGDVSKAAVLKERLTEIEAEFSDEPAYLALIRAEYNSKKPE